MEKRCRNYVGITCVDGSCPIANAEEYEEQCIPIVKKCIECYFYKGCEDCVFCGTEYCDKERVVQI